MHHKAAYDAYIQRVLGLMESGTAPWHKPWNAASGIPSNLVTKRPYQGSNLFFLGIEAQVRGSPWFLTYRQAQAAGGQVRRGAKGIPVVLWKPSTYTTEDEDGEAEERRSLVSRVYHVFNVQDVDGVDHLIPPTRRLEGPDIPAAVELLLSIQPTPVIRYGGNRAYYRPARDYIQMPNAEDFDSVPDYYATLLHELTHWTGHPSRLDRETIRDAQPFGSYDYSREELVAEMGAGYLCSLLGLENDVVEQSAAYLRSWADGIQRDPNALVWAANRASQAAAFLTKNWKAQAPLVAAA